MTPVLRGSGRSYRTLAALLELTAKGRRCFFITLDPWTYLTDMARTIARNGEIARLQPHDASRCLQIGSAATMIIRPDRVMHEMEQSVRGRLGSLYAVDHYVLDARLVGTEAWAALSAFPKKVLERIDV